MVARVRKIVLCVVLLMGFAWQSGAGPGVEIAAIYALTGPAAYGNAKSLLGVRVAVEEINSKGGILGMPTALTVYDNMSTPIGSSFAAEKAAASDAVAIVGAAWSSHSMAVARVAHHQALTVNRVPINPATLVVGAGITGIQAALELADADYPVYLVEREPSIGGRMAQLDETFPTLDCSA